LIIIKLAVIFIFEWKIDILEVVIMNAAIDYRENRKILRKLEGVQAIFSFFFFSFLSFPGAVFVSIYFIIVVVLGHFASIDEIISMIAMSMHGTDGGAGGLADFADVAGSRFTIVYYISVAMAVVYQVGRQVIKYFFD